MALCDKTVQPEVAEVQLDSGHDSRITPKAPVVTKSSAEHRQQEGTSSIGQAITTSGDTKADAPVPGKIEAADLQDARAHKSNGKNGLTKVDVQGLFSGAPQYTLEKGRRGRYFPQAFFPWNNDLDISDLQDRRYLRHESFALSTLHAHLPIPNEVEWKPGMMPPVQTSERLETNKRPMFELGIFERPNMLGLEGKEPGTVGMRYFLERPVADGLQDENIKEHGKDVELDLALSHVPAMEAFKMLAVGRGNEEMDAKIGKHAPALDRAKLIKGGSHAWKAAGVRDLNMGTIADRFEVIQHWRDHVLNAGWRTTVLDHITSAELHEHLFSEVLYPPRKVSHDTKHEHAGLKIQIEALVKVLTTPGAWLDLSIPEARLRLGKILHGNTTHYSHETGTFCVEPERKWALVQLLLAVELVIRLDAALRLGVAQHSESFELNSDEIHHFNKLRNLKVDWDLVLARRFITLSTIKKIEKKGNADQGATRPTLQQKSPEPHTSFIGKFFSHNEDNKRSDAKVVHDLCDVTILPRQAQVMVGGLIRFASNIGWPRTLEIQEQLRRKLCQTEVDERDKFLMDAVSCVDISERANNQPLGNVTRPLGNFYVDLQASTPTTVGGWLSHSWLSGLILPGSSICDMLMATLLENDTDPNTITKLDCHGTHPLRGSGFVLDGSSWWSKSCIVGRVLAPMHGAKESMGWISAPNVVPLYDSTKKPLSDRWVKIKTYPVPTTRQRPRIFDGEKIAIESTPLGMGKGGIHGAEFSMVTDHILDDETKPKLDVKDITIHLSSSDAPDSSPSHPLAAWIQFELTLTPPTNVQDSPRPEVITKRVRYGLSRAVYFITAFPCRLPHGHATFAPGSADADYEQYRQPPKHKSHEHIPAHPLHKTYKFATKTLSDLVGDGSGGAGADAVSGVEPPNPCLSHDSEVWVIDARSLPVHSSHQSGSHSEAHYLSNFYSNGSASTPASPSLVEAGGEATLDSTMHSQLWTRDILVRSWCAEKGRNALIARVGRTCLSCAIREAKALEISVVIRVGMME
ncbi:uncharacterized protein A1O9_03294 [Exophiala aquamarina CBS 119918]|uniref:Uncharacterized protein n=1 Tax=Exophiala aquamarina CBS 119918 TaxID=1182545 RepID=A0A072PNS5_9EURO|nr:uncharacterized protein A1O9_03294 [Exophiala aquamarina CBS 119918]KEF61724.1 hypothetical protein A1O9_03294 [Exophiala aquamarina CBS 119918]